MTKREAKAVGQLITIGIVLYPFFWVYQQIGPGGLGVIVICASCAVVGWKILKRKREQRAFDSLALHMLHHRLSQDEVKTIFSAMAKSNFGRFELVRNLKVLRESIDISLGSKKRETAEARMQTVEECYRALLGPYRDLVSVAVLDEVSRVVEHTREHFKKALFLNVARGYVEKAVSLKTVKSKLKYLGLARAVLEEGLEAHKNDTDLHQALVHVYRMSEELSGSTA